MAKNGYTRRRFGEQVEVHELLIVGTVPKNQRDWVRVRLTLIEGRLYVDVRVYTNINGELRPTRKGISIRVDDALHELIKALTQAATFASDEW